MHPVLWRAVTVSMLLTALPGATQAPAGAESAAAASAVPEVLDDEALEATILAACARLREQSALTTCKALQAGAAAALGKPIESAPVRERALAGPDLRDLVLRSLRIVGHHYRCRECDKWHFSGASGFCIDTAGTIVTCQHVVPDDETMLDAALVVADLAGHVWPVQGVLAADSAADLVLLRTAARDTVALPVRGGVRAGERVYCASNPDHQFGFFSEGLVARRFRLREPAGAAVGAVPPAAGAAALPAPEWLHVTCDFAKGSSGGPIVDAMGNVVGIAQSTSTVVYDEDAQPIDTQMVFKIAAPASALLQLLRPAPARAAAPPAGGAPR